MRRFEDIVALLRAAGEPTRLRILRLLLDWEFNVKDLTELLGQSQPRISRHLRLLAEAGLIERQHEGSWVFVRSTADPAVRNFISGALAMIAPDDPEIGRDLDRAHQIRARRAANAQSYFDKIAPEWDRIRALHVCEREVDQAILETLDAGPFDLLLDLGTGTGRILELAASRAKQVIGIDTNKEMLKCARVRLDSAKLSHCSVRLGDIHNLPFAEDSADAAVMHQVLHFLDSPKAALAEACRVLKPGACFLLADFAPHTHEFLREEHAHVRLGFAAEEVNNWLTECGFAAGAYRELAAGGGHRNALTVAIWAAKKRQRGVRLWRTAS
jgi:ubiquinone/menaquinone biosynthesis C-methylase UbiE/DNA-binding transcriptional ArsR family regulator